MNNEFVNKKIMIISKKDKIEILENAFSYIVIFAMFAYGSGKIVQFKNAVDITKTVADMTGMELMWAFYGHSFAYVVTIGILEITGGILMLIKKTRIIGCLFVTAILSNIILQDIYFGVNRGALKAAMLYQLLILIILWLNKEKLIQSTRLLYNLNKVEQSKKKLGIKLLLSLLLFAIFRIVEFYITIKW